MPKLINELPIHKFTSDSINNCFYIENTNKPNVKIVSLENVFEWIKKEAIRNGLTVEMTDEKKIFIKNK